MPLSLHHRTDLGAAAPDAERRQFIKMSVATLAPSMLTGCWSHGSPEAPRYEATVTDAQTAIREAMSTSNLPSVSVALVDRDRVIWVEAFGLADRTNRVPATTETLFCIGSCSKLLATIAVMILVDRGEVELDQPLKRYLPSFTMTSPEHTRITVRMLLTHSSGLPGTEYRGLFRSAPCETYADDVLRSLATVRLKHTPGEFSTYCNDGYTLVEPLVRAVSGKAYTRFVGDEILAPLGMVRSCFTERTFGDGVARTYGGEIERPLEYVAGYAAGGLYTNPAEMARIARMLLGFGAVGGVRILRRESVTEMGRDQVAGQPRTPIPLTEPHGLGWDSVCDGGLAAVGATVWNKSGATPTYASDLLVAPDEGLAVMIMGAATFDASGLARRILCSALAERRGGIVPRPIGNVIVSPSEVPRAEIAGIYARSTGVLRLQPQADGTLALDEFAEAGWVRSLSRLTLRGDGRYVDDALPTHAYSVATALGDTYLIVRMAMSAPTAWTTEIVFCQRMTAGTALSAAWRARCGPRWLLVNEPIDNEELGDRAPTLTLAGVPDLPGYVLVTAPKNGKSVQIVDASTSDSIGRMCLRIPGHPGRDLDDLIVESRSGEQWLRIGTALYRPAATVPTYDGAASAVTIDSNGHSEWRRIAVASTLVIANADAWKVYDADFRMRDFARGRTTTGRLTTGDWLQVYGRASTSITLSPVA